jgi:hypothetical protein
LSGRVCYLARAWGGERIASVRLVGVRGEEAWQPQGDAEADQSQAAAKWVAARCGRSGVSLVCVDVGGGECGWLTAPGAEESVVAAAMAQEGSPWAASRAGWWAAPAPEETSVQALAVRNGGAAARRRAGAGEDEGAIGQRLAVLAIPDVEARLFVDGLDERGVSVERAASLWHAMAMAWDPAGPLAQGGERDGVVATSTVLTAVVLVDPGMAGDPRLVWSWSRAGELLAAGTIRIPERREQRALAVGAPEVGRLTSDWLAWSVQLGEAPSRVICIGPETPEGPEALSPAMLGAAITRAWPGVTVDLAVDDDPIGATLGRLAAADEDDAAADDSRRTLLTLTHRPGRAHRTMYRWIAAAVVLLALGLTAVAWKAWDQAGRHSRQAARARAAMTDVVAEAAPPSPTSDLEADAAREAPREYLRGKLETLRQTMSPDGGLEPVKPILQELEALSLVLESPGVEVTEINLDSSIAVVTVLVPDTRTGEELIESLRSVAGSSVTWTPKWMGRGVARGDKPNMQQLNLEGIWRPRGEAAGGQP